MNVGGASLWIKVCGLRTAEAVEAAASAGANAVGFVFHVSSPRHLEATQARELARAVPDGVEKVAVFLHPTQQLLEVALEAVEPDWVQTDYGDLAGLELPAGLRVLPVFRSGHVADLAHRNQARYGVRFLLESAKSGAGEQADWAEAGTAKTRGELVLAGGLTPGNVDAALTAVRPFGIDVSSGVERSRGVKDAALIHEFVSKARAAQARIASSMGDRQR